GSAHVTDRPRNPGGSLTPVAVPAVSAAAAGGDADPSSSWRVVQHLAQDAPGFTKSWYCHPDADLFLWTKPDEGIAAFQFCFDKRGDEQMVAWDRERPVEVGRVDGGESSPLHNRSPVLDTRSGGPRTRAHAAWEELKAGLPAEVIRFVETALRWS
ncbi:MAG: hypothetical protein AB2A00_21570, partial [Myxococcota bacterium]